MRSLILGVALLWSAMPAAAADWYWGLGLGYFDVDHDDSDLPHMESGTGTAFIGYSINDYLGLEIQAEHISTGTDVDADGFRSEFGGSGVSPALIVRYPLDREDLFEAYVRLGGTYIDYELATPTDGGRRVEGTEFQPAFGAGIRTKYLFLEYTNYGQLDELYLEQIRAGLIFRF